LFSSRYAAVVLPVVNDSFVIDGFGAVSPFAADPIKALHFTILV